MFVELSDTKCSMDSELLVNKQVILVYFILSFKRVGEVSSEQWSSEQCTAVLLCDAA